MTITDVGLLGEIIPIDREIQPRRKLVDSTKACVRRGVNVGAFGEVMQVASGGYGAQEFLGDEPERPSFARSLLLAAKVANSEIERRLKQYGVSASGWAILDELSRHDTVGQGELAGLCGMEAPTLSRNLDRLVKNGWATRIRDRFDRRALHVAITPDGISQLILADGVVAGFEDELSPAIGLGFTQGLSYLVGHGCEGDSL